ncbi:MAG: hypothetical protein ACYS8Z_22005, partial [Planctomycetota bacterium]
VWYAETDTPVGPWAYARKVVTHDKYTFYNPKQHPYFDQKGGRLIYFEGTYSHTFSGNPNPTPRYDYNQIMYRLDLADKRLSLPEPVYEIKSTEGEILYLLGPQAHPHARAGRVKRIPFYAVSPERRFDRLIPLYAAKAASIVAKPPAESSRPLFFAVPPSKAGEIRNEMVATLFEYVNTRTGQKRYATDNIRHNGWQKSETPLCIVWKKPTDAITADWQAESWAE